MIFPPSHPLIHTYPLKAVYLFILQIWKPAKRRKIVPRSKPESQKMAALKSQCLGCGLTTAGEWVPLIYMVFAYFCDVNTPISYQCDVTERGIERDAQ